jgi:hypothetical protein
MHRALHASFAVALLAAAVTACGTTPAHPTGQPAATRVISPAASTTTGAAPTVPGSPSRAPATAGSSPEQPTDRRGGTGITGQTLIDGGCPVIRADSPCPNRPVAATLSLLDATTNAVRATITTDAQGHFTTAAPPGSYLLHADRVAGQLPRRPETMPVTVTAGRYTPVTMVLDSGIR